MYAWKKCQFLTTISCNLWPAQNFSIREQTILLSFLNHCFSSLVSRCWWQTSLIRCQFVVRRQCCAFIDFFRHGRRELQQLLIWISSCREIMSLLSMIKEKEKWYKPACLWVHRPPPPPAPPTPPPLPCSSLRAVFLSFDSEVRFFALLKIAANSLPVGHGLSVSWKY